MRYASKGEKGNKVKEINLNLDSYLSFTFSIQNKTETNRHEVLVQKVNAVICLFLISHSGDHIGAAHMFKLWNIHSFKVSMSWKPLVIIF